MHKCGVHLIRTHYPHWGKYTGINRFVEYIDPEKFKIDDRVVPMGESNFPISSPRIKKRLRRWIKKNGVREYDLNDLMAETVALGQWLRGRADIVHYLDGEHSLQYLPSLTRQLKFLRKKASIVATFHQPPQDLEFLLNVDIVRRLDRVIVISPDQTAYFEQYLPKHKISLVLHGVDVDYFHPATESQKTDKFRCLSVGSWLRDYDRVLAVADRLQTHADIEFHIVSPKVSALPEQKNIYIYKDIDDTHLLRLYQQSDVLFLPLLGATANNAILEGMACGLPIISTDLTSIRAYLPGKEAILISDNNVELCVKTILDLYNSPNICQEMARAARLRAIELSWQNVARQMELIYASLIC